MPLTSFFFVRVGAVDVGVDAGDKGIEFDVDGLPRFAAETFYLARLGDNQKYLMTGLNLLNIPDKGKFRNLLEMAIFTVLFFGRLVDSVLVL